LLGQWYVAAISAMLGIVIASNPKNSQLIFIFFIMMCWLFFVKKKIVVSVLFFIVYGTYFYIYDLMNETNFTGNETFIVGEIHSVQVNSNQMTSNVETVQGENILVKGPNSLNVNILPGQICKMYGILEQPKSSRNFYDFDYRNYLRRKQIHWLFKMKDIQCIESRSLSIINQLKRLRLEAMKVVDQTFSQKTKGLANALILGKRTDLSDEVIEVYRKHGLAHLLAISGLHVGIIFYYIYWLLLRAGITRERTLEILLLFLLGYIVMTGATASILRAGTMAMLYMLAQRFKIKVTPIDTLSITFLLLITINPYAIFEIGFQFSFIVTFFLVTSAPGIINKYQSPFKQILAVTVIAQFASLPIILFYNYEFSLWSFPLNLIFVPLYTFVILPAVLLSFVTFFMPQISDLIILIIENVFVLSNSLLQVIDEIKIGVITLGQPSIFLLYCYYLALIFLHNVWERTMKLKAMVLAIIPLLFVCTFHWLLPFLNSHATVTFLDVGQGDAIVIELPHRKGVYVIDTGRKVENKSYTYDAGKSVVVPYLKAKGIRNVDKLIISHSDLDHIGGALSLLFHIRVKELIVSESDSSNQLEELLKVAKILKVDIKKVRKGYGWQKANEMFFVIHPTKKHYSRNNASIVLYAVIGNMRWLFTGDIEEEAEQEILKNFQNVKLDVLKVSHHGSKTSTSEAFLKVFTPKIAVISVGEKNFYGHPNPKVTKRLNNNEIVSFRTDLHGAVQFMVKNNVPKIRTAKKKRWIKIHLHHIEY
jgi:competence protein ComEC